MKNQRRFGLPASFRLILLLLFAGTSPLSAQSGMLVVRVSGSTGLEAPGATHRYSAPKWFLNETGPVVNYKQPYVDRNRANDYTAFDGVQVFDMGGRPVPFTTASGVFLSALCIPNSLIRERLVYLASLESLEGAPLPAPGMTYADTVNLT